MEKDIIEKSMAIILHAGDARVHCMNAMKALEEFDTILAKQHITKASEEITKAHKIQTDVIQDEMRGDNINNSILFTHAQDTLMTIYSEINLTKRLIKVVEQISNRLERLEKNV